MFRLSPRHVTPVPAASVTLGVALLVVIWLSLAVQPPRVGGANGLQQILAWARAALLSGGAFLFLLGLFSLLRSGGVPSRAQRTDLLPFRRGGDEPQLTLVALGGTPDDTRAIADTDGAGEAVALLRRWSDSHPEEHVVIFLADGEPIAFRRPRTALLTAGGAG